MFKIGEVKIADNELTKGCGIVRAGGTQGEMRKCSVSEIMCIDSDIESAP